MKGKKNLLRDLPPAAPDEAFEALLLPAHCRHRVTWTDPAQPTVWLALHVVAS